MVPCTRPTAEQSPLPVLVGLFTVRKESSVTSVPWDSLAPHPRGGSRTAGAQHVPSPEPSSPAPEHSGHFHLLSPLLPPAPVSSRHPTPSHSTLAALKPCAREHLDQCTLHIPGVLGRVPTWPGVDCPGFYHKLGVGPILTHKCH